MSEPASVLLADSLDLAAAAPLARALIERRGKPVRLDASAVRRVGGQCLQVLLSAQAAWAADSQPFEIVNATDEFAGGLALMGADRLLRPVPSEEPTP